MTSPPDVDVFTVADAALFAFVVRHSADAIVLVDDAGCVVLANVSAHRLFGRDVTGALLGLPLGGDEPVRLDVRRPDGEVSIVELRGASARIEGRPMHVAVFRDVTHLVEQIEALRRESHRDALTGVLNRRGFVAMAEGLLRLARRERRPLAILYVDVDGLKALNDTAGHAAGDEALRSTAEALTSAVRDSDVVGRLGGDEFAMVLWDADEGVGALVARVRTAVGQALADRGGLVGVSIGVSTWCPTGSAQELPELDVLLEEADGRMYEDKRRRRVRRRA